MGDPVARCSDARYSLTSAKKVTGKAAVDGLLRDYYGVIFRKLAIAGVRWEFAVDELIAAFWLNFHKFLPHHWRLILVRDDRGALVGRATLHQIRAGAGKVKRLFVYSSASGHRLGRAILEAGLQAARQMGWRRVLVDAIKGNQDMLRIYQQLGFEFIDRYPECTDPIEVDPYFVYLQREFD